MIKLEGGLGYFVVNDESFPIGEYRIVYKEDNVGIEEKNDHMVIFPTSFTDWRDELDAVYGTRDDLLNDLRSKIFSRV